MKSLHVDLPPFVAARRWSGGHRMTVYAWARRRSFPRLPEPDARFFDVAPETRVLAHVYWQPARTRATTLLALHGLEGSSRAHYMRGLADKAFARGLNVVLLNQRNCGGTESLSSGLYHSGLTHDPVTVMRELVATERLPAFVVAGYSLGGNLTLKLAGDFGNGPPRELKAVCAVSPTMDLAYCVDALERRSNFAYQWNFVRNLKARMRRKAAVWPGRYDVGPLKRVRTVRQFDDAYTAPHHGFRNASDYYHRASAMRVVNRIAVPTLIDRFGYSASAMYDLYAELTQPSEALLLAQEMAKALPTNRTWPTRVTVQEAMVRAESLVADARFADALALLEKTQRPSGSHGTTWTLFKAEAAAGSGHVDQAYAALLDSAVALPDARADAALLKYGTTLGKTQRDVDADIWGLRDAKAKVAVAFELPSARDGSLVKLADYRGRVVLLAFWFPG